MIATDYAVEMIEIFSTSLTLEGTKSADRIARLLEHALSDVPEIENGCVRFAFGDNETGIEKAPEDSHF